MPENKDTNHFLLEHMLKQAAQVGKVEASIEGLREQHKFHAEQMQRDNLTLNVKIDSQGDKLDNVLEYINTQKGQKIAIIGFATLFAAGVVKAWDAIAAKLSL